MRVADVSLDLSGIDWESPWADLVDEVTERLAQARHAAGLPPLDIEDEETTVDRIVSEKAR